MKPAPPVISASLSMLVRFSRLLKTSLDPEKYHGAPLVYRFTAADRLAEGLPVSGLKAPGSCVP